MDNIHISELVSAVKGELLQGDASKDTVISEACSDNRIAREGSVFFAFKGENTDGHKYVKAALEAGATAAVISDSSIPHLPASYSGRYIIRVEDTLKAAGDLAAWYRRRFDIPVVGVTGSVGKTTMKDMIYSVLSEAFNVTATEGNFNNNIGLPRTVLRIDSDSQAAVLEMGMNHMGEIDYLTRIAAPTMAVITNVGDAHIGNLGSRENIFKAKCEIFNGLAEGGFAVMNADDEYLPLLKEDADKQGRYDFVWIGEDESADLRAVNIDDSSSEGLTFDMLIPSQYFRGTVPGMDDLVIRRVRVPAPGRHMIYPALAACAIGLRSGMSLDLIIRGIEHFTPSAKRMETWQLDGGITVYNDTYNANPQSMKAGLKTLSNTKAAARIAVLGDMLELGDMEEALHREVGAAAAEAGIDLLVTVGPAATYICDEALKRGPIKAVHFDDNDSALKAISEAAREYIGAAGSGDVCPLAVYFKASHAMAFDKLSAAFKDLLINIDNNM
ncbi:UDP-N-acetylmuramoyl-tripeptide--D-alanyl-D-alanine ligase [Butyrivibrio sp. MC2013]|uniref:UDP-N-acetylmuramoyl-tripeptide--D-alanyl-D- alanine ligase n=1 Tax=Butyrivibrio sp. MC2013 TaxID=1280686 RepID=UPI000411DBD7|nr:UDP-N-acetylmuramoyl-tripeptide--D-alanyl-D-alanine ligase [Butyrivibrio sp. MC2013]